MSGLAWSPFTVRLNPIGDGNCQFVSICDQLQYIANKKLEHECLRRDIVEYLSDHPTTPDGARMEEFATDKYYRTGTIQHMYGL